MAYPKSPIAIVFEFAIVALLVAGLYELMVAVVWKLAKTRQS
jgi:hypothetical protein